MMDKGDKVMMSKARITYRFDKHPGGKIVPAREQAKPTGTVIPLRRDGSGRDGEPELNRFTHDFGEWTSPFDTETKRIEQLIREADARPARPAYEEPVGWEPQREEAYREAPLPQPQSPQQAQSQPQPLQQSPGSPEVHAYNVLESNDVPPLNSTGYYSLPDSYEAERDHHTVYTGPFLVDENLSSKSLRYGSGSGSRPPWLKIFASVAGAVLTGVCFGFFALNLFTGNSGIDKAIPLPNPATTAQTNAAVPDGVIPLPKVQAPAALPASIDLPAVTYSFLQNGVFSSEKSAASAESELRKKGLAAASEAGEKYTVYVGVTANRDDALALSHKLQAQQVDVYIKNVAMPAMKQVSWGGNSKADGLGAFLSQGRQLIDRLDRQTVSHLNETKLTAPSAQDVQTLKADHQAWTGLFADVTSGAPATAKSTLQSMSNAMNTAVISLDEYQKNPSAAYLWQAQTSILQYILSEKTLLTAITAN
jgi:stage II sporulation protein B